MAIVNFELTKRGIAVDLALRGKAIYLQAGKPSDRLYRTMEAPRIIVELGGHMPNDKWEVIWQKAIRRRLRTEGPSRAESKRLTPKLMERMRSTFNEARSLPNGIYVSPDDPPQQV